MRMRTNPRASMGLRFNRTAPIVTILIFMSGWLVLDAPIRESAELVSHRTRIAERMDSFPYQLADWVGTDVPVPTAAMEILNPNSLVSRRYRRLNSDDEMIMALIHCSDTRDMQGHYPPICYPARGWNLVDEDVSRIPMTLGSHEVDMSLYRFRRFDRSGLEQTQMVLSMFLLPNGLVMTDMEAIRGRSAGGRALSATGVAQLQMVFSDAADTDSVIEQANSLMKAVPEELISALRAPILARASSNLTEGDTP